MREYMYSCIKFTLTVQYKGVLYREMNDQRKVRSDTMGTVKITKDNFKAEVLDSKVPVLVDFWATWCGPCQMQAPVLDEIVAENNDIKIGKINIDDEQLLAIEHGVTSIPTLMLFKDGHAVKTLVGLRQKDELMAELEL